MTDDLGLVDQLITRIKPILAGHSPDIQGAVLADLLAIWLAGHIDPDSPRETRKIRDSLLHNHLDAVRTLVPIEAAVIARRAG
jgi:hypothetical protein